MELELRIEHRGNHCIRKRPVDRHLSPENRAAGPIFAIIAFTKPGGTEVRRAFLPFFHRLPAWRSHHPNCPVASQTLDSFFRFRTVHSPMKELKDYVTEIPDFPKPGILFRDVTTIISDPDGLRLAIDGLIDMMEGLNFDLVVGSESRGFVFGTPVAYAMDKGFILVRKKGKLPRETISESYDLEYGTAELEMHADAIKPGQRVIIIDDLIATGGTTEAIVKLVEREGGVVVKIGFVMELAGLKGREKLKGYDIGSLITYEGA